MKTKKEISKEVFEKFIENPTIKKNEVNQYDNELLQKMIKEEWEKYIIEQLDEMREVLQINKRKPNEDEKI
jgi:glucuronate isomerase